MNLSTLDWSIIAGFFVLSLAVGIASSRKAGNSAAEFFLSGRNMPWWLLGVSMVATTFSADTPNFVTDLIRNEGVSGNWKWWAFLLTGMLTVFVYARLWRKSGVLTDLEFYELRYSGKEASFLRGFRALYLGVVFNIIIMATVCLAAIKIGGVLLGLSPIQTLLIASVVTVIYSSIGGLRGVILTDFVQFIIAIVGAIWASVVILDMPQINGLSGLLSNPAVIDKMDLLPDFNDSTQWIPLLLIPLAVQWWSVWYPGAEPGGGGYIAQRMLSAKNEKHAIGATLLFNIAHYALRPWPWIIIGLASLIIFPNIPDLSAPAGSLAARGLVPLAEAFPNIPLDKVGHDLAYPAMLAFLPAGLLGLVLASLIAAFMSTISSHLNWGASYLVNDVYVRFVKPESSDKEQVVIGRVATVLLMLFAAIFALYLESAIKSFDLILKIGAGTGLIFILRWFWWRINIYTELAGMIISLVVAIVFNELNLGWDPNIELVASVGITTVGWLIVTFITKPTSNETLKDFYTKIQPGGPGWKRIRKELGIVGKDKASVALPYQILAMVVGSVFVYSALFASGSFIYGRMQTAWLLTGVLVISGFVLFKLWKKISLSN